MQAQSMTVSARTVLFRKNAAISQIECLSCIHGITTHIPPKSPIKMSEILTVSELIVKRNSPGRKYSTKYIADRVLSYIHAYTRARGIKPSMFQNPWIPSSAHWVRDSGSDQPLVLDFSKERKCFTQTCKPFNPHWTILTTRNGMSNWSSNILQKKIIREREGAEMEKQTTLIIQTVKIVWESRYCQCHTSEILTPLPLWNRLKSSCQTN